MNSDSLLTVYIIVAVIVAIVYSVVKSVKDRDSNPLEVAPIAFCIGITWPLIMAIGCIYTPFFLICLLTKYIMRKKEERKERNNRKEVCRTI